MASDVSSRDSRSVFVGDYQVLGHIASGAMGAVYRALDPVTRHEVAVKVLLPELIAGRPTVVERFRREALHSARLRHENIVALYDFGEANGTYFLVLELVEGVNLQERIQARGPLEPEEARAILIQIARALDHAHRQLLVHRDVKPANVLLADQDGQTLAKLADFGLAREVRDEEFRLTREGSTVGTVDYMAPEQARNSAAADIRSDLYSLGCTFFHMLAGVPPFHRGSLTERLYQHADAEPPDVRTFNAHVPPELVAVLRRLLAKKPEDRFQTPEELLNHLLPPPEPVPAAPAVLAEEPAPAPREPADKPARAAPPRRSPPRRKVTPAVPQTPNARIAAGQFKWASEQLARGNRDYGIELLLTCCRLDPTNLDYHRALGLALKGRRSRGPAGWFRRVRNFACRVRLKLARRAGDALRVLALGEELLVRDPGDVDTYLAMAAAAEGLGAGDLALWLLGQARAQDGTSAAVGRALGRYYESRNDYEQAIACWEVVARAAPGKTEAEGKLRDLAALQALQQNRQRQRTEQAHRSDTEG